MTYSDIPRVDALDKVRGLTEFGTDVVLPDMAHGAFAVATIGRGRILRIDLDEAARISGVYLILTHETTGAIRPGKFLLAGGFSVQGHSPILTPEVAYRGQPVAMVVADTLEIATEAAALIRIEYDAMPFATHMDGDAAEAVRQADAPLGHPIPDIVVGDAVGGFAAAEFTVDATYAMDRQFQNPMELVGTVAHWDAGRLTVHEGTQNANGARFGLAAQLGLSPENVTVISPFVGGGFGQKNSMQTQQVLAAFAARELGRPVKVVVPRRQLFHDASSRPATLQRVRLGANAEGRFTSMLYDIDQQTSRHDLFPAEQAGIVARFYGYGAIQTHSRLVRTDIPTPGYMRAPFEHGAAFALESAVDEMAWRLGADPVALRILNDTDTDVVTGRPHSSRHLRACLERGAERFGWSRRDPAPRSMRAANGDLVGYGVAVGLYKGSSGANVARLIAGRDGQVLISVGVHEMGQGVRTAIANVVAARLGVAPENVVAVLGDTRGVHPQLTAGSWGSASAIPAAEKACDALLAALSDLGVDTSGTLDLSAILTRLNREEIAVEASNLAPGQGPQVFGNIHAGFLAPAGPIYPDFVTYSHAAHFVEVRVEASTGRVRVPRVVSTFDCGRVLSPRTARSQGIGGVVWGIGGTLHEGAELDARYGGVMNADIAEYLVPVNADIGEIEIGFIDQPDYRLNASGVKGLGEIVMVGVAPAITNAVFHATGTRVRHLPLRLEALI